MSFVHCWEPSGITTTDRGDLVLEEVLESHQRMAADPRFDDLKFMIVDTLPVERVALIESDVVQINAFLTGPALTNPNIFAVVIALHPAVLRFVAVYAQLPDRRYDMRVCSSMVSARQLLAHRDLRAIHGKGKA
ncbi:MAG TPA: hypothetical protein PKV56_17910 [Burkholderiaceae bacterium]|jgi:hypothetical protein|nr:hypothetical protein [Burkholderiaceae bacterium]